MGWTRPHQLCVSAVELRLFVVYGAAHDVLPLGHAAEKGAETLLQYSPCTYACGGVGALVKEARPTTTCVPASAPHSTTQHVASGEIVAGPFFLSLHAFGVASGSGRVLHLLSASSGYHGQHPPGYVTTRTAHAARPQQRATGAVQSARRTSTQPGVPPPHPARGPEQPEQPRSASSLTACA